MLRKLKEKYDTIRLIREAINTYPDGICFAAAGGRPILTNHAITQVCYQLTGHTITNADAMWDELDRLKIETPAFRENEVPPADVEQILCRLPDESVWQFQRRTLRLDTSQVMQYDASDITELYHRQRQLMENNARLVKLHDRQRILLQNIVQNNVSKELLSAKVRIHDRFGGLLVMTKNALANEDGKNGRSDLISGWRNVIADMENASIGQNQDKASPENELRKIAGMIGCEVEFIGDQPAERKATLLLYAAIREALTNAVRHADASRLTVQIKTRNDAYRIRIMSNGKTDIPSIREGGGLSSLRKRLEQDGAEMNMETDHGVVMVLTIPKE